MDMLREGTNGTRAKNVRCTSARKETERKTENRVGKTRVNEIRKCGVRGGGRIGQNTVEECLPFRPLHMVRTNHEE